MSFGNTGRRRGRGVSIDPNVQPMRCDPVRSLPWVALGLAVTLRRTIGCYSDALAMRRRALVLWKEYRALVRYLPTITTNRWHLCCGGLNLLS